MQSEFRSTLLTGRLNHGIELLIYCAVFELLLAALLL